MLMPQKWLCLNTNPIKVLGHSKSYLWLLFSRSTGHIFHNWNGLHVLTSHTRNVTNDLHCVNFSLHTLFFITFLCTWHIATSDLCIKFSRIPSIHYQLNSWQLNWPQCAINILFQPPIWVLSLLYHVSWLTSIYVPSSLKNTLMYVMGRFFSISINQINQSLWHHCSWLWIPLHWATALPETLCQVPKYKVTSDRRFDKIGAQSIDTRDKSGTKIALDSSLGSVIWDHLGLLDPSLIVWYFEHHLQAFICLTLSHRHIYKETFKFHLASHLMRCPRQNQIWAFRLLKQTVEICHLKTTHE